MENCSTSCSENSQLEKLVQDYLAYGEEHLLDEVVKSAEPLVRHFAVLFSGGRPIEDYMQAGYEGILKALKNFNANYGNSFVTYAGHCIMGEIRHYIRREASYYRPVVIAELQKKVEILIEEYFTGNGELPSMDYLSAKLNVKREGIEQAMRAGMVCLDELDISKISHVRYESFRFPIEDRIILEQAVKMLSDIQRKVIYLLFYRDMTQEQAAEKLGLNQRKVSRILHGSLDSLRKNLS